MKHRAFFSAAVALASMTGCNSLNTTTVYVNNTTELSSQLTSTFVIPQPPASAQAAVVVAPPLAPKKIDHALQLCPLFHSPVFPKTPELPTKEILQVGPGNPLKIEQIERKYIEDLRSYIETMQALVARAHSQYQAQCRAYLKK